MKNLGRRILLATLFGVAVYAVIAFASDVRKLRDHLEAFEWWTFAGALGLAFANYVLRFLKWEYYLRRLDVGTHAPGEKYRGLPVLESFVIYLSGFAMSITPGKAGEVFKSVLLASARGVPVARSAPIVVADRLTDLLSLIILVGVGSAFFPGYGWIALVATAMVAGVLLFVVFEGLAAWVINLVERFGPGKKLAPKLREAYAALKLMTSPVALVWATAVSAVAWGFECAGLWLILRGLHAPVSVFLAFFVYATATIAGAIAMLPGGLGGTELVMQGLLRGLGHVGESAAGAATLLVRLATLWFAVAVGFVAYVVFQRRYDRNATPAASTTTVAV